ncbi:cysteine hydrolase family protein [Rhizobium sp. SL42]|uniref:cysteine hydrolase family protein n=1 Tax=Rhizobium sp. SL42 TaxID=2806346 RepID=UPI001F197DA6|nr:isochorismatase family protein [Rhizobium sp. SL42]UJW75724.1 isochorismatase family protein [Rhizobium sp. SL42]
MSAEKTALIVIDVQESFRQCAFWTTDDLAAYVEKQQALIDGAKTAGIPIIQIFHVDSDAPFTLDSGFVTTLAELEIKPDITFHKSVHSALVGTGLEDWLKANGISRLIVSGIRTEQCCETTTRHAADTGYGVDFVTEATLTFAMTHASGIRFSPAEIRMRTELVLAGRFARIATVEDALDTARKAA